LLVGSQAELSFAEDLDDPPLAKANDRSPKDKLDFEHHDKAINAMRKILLALHALTFGLSLAAIWAKSTPCIFSMVVAGLLVLNAVLFVIRERCLSARKSHIVEEAARSSAIVQSLFPAVVRDRVFDSAKVCDKQEIQSRDSVKSKFSMTTRQQLEKYLLNETEVETEPHVGCDTDPPMAELFPSVTISFADIAGFTAWSSKREPHQVFQLLEKLYRAFDKIAHRLGVFKVETIGDYVAVAGLPDAREDHAQVMALFAWECQRKMSKITKKLEASLGPGTSDLALRTGLHSGHVTAGVLRGDKSRFQLFGDTMNTAARMESTGKTGSIQCSEATANFLRKRRKNHWLNPVKTLSLPRGKA
jgi:class 3 adenylate cyclase